MPILTGFPPSNTISPSVRFNELDLTFIDTAPSVHACGLVGFATKGPVNVPTLIATVRQLHATFGYPDPAIADPYMIYAGEQYLQFANQLYVVRVAETDPSYDYVATTAAVDIPASGGAVNIIGNVTGSYVFSIDQFFYWSLNGVASSKVLTVLAGTYTAAQLVVDLNDQLTAADGIIFSVSTTSCLEVSSTLSFGTAASIELLSIQNAMYGPGSLVGMGTTMTVAGVTGSVTKYPNNSYQTAGNYNFVGLSSLYLNVVVSGTENVNIDGVVQQVLIPTSNTTATAISNYINAQITGASIPGGFVASVVSNSIVLKTLAAGEDSTILVKSNSTAATLLGLDSTTHFGTSPSAVSNQNVDATYAAGIVTGSSASGGLLSFTVTADSPGTTGNLTQVVISNNTQQGTFNIQVFNNGSQVESWGGLVKNPTSSYYVETYLSLLSQFILVVDNTSTLVTPLAGIYSLSGGSDGIPVSPDAQDSLLIGDDVGYTGMYSLSNPEIVDIDLFAVPGHSSSNVVLAGLDLCQNQRQDCIYIVDPPFGLTVNEIIAWVNGTSPLNSDYLDNDFGALYWPWVKIRDTYNLIDVWVPPSTVVIGTIVNSDDLTYPWYAPAGQTRGIVYNVEDTYTQPTLADRDAMYGNQNCINPIIMFADLATFTIWGQKTMQRLPSALDRVNVRRMLLYVEKLVSRAVRGLLFEPNDTTLQGQFISIVTNILNTVQRDRGITAFFVECDSTLNTPATIDKNELHANVGLQPTYAAEFIYIQFSLNATGSFTQNTNTF